MISIFAIDDDESFLDSVTNFFSAFPGIYEMVGQFSQLYDKKEDEDYTDELLETIEATKPEIILMDFGFQKIDRPADYGVELTKKIRKLLPSQKVIMLVGDSPFSDNEVLSMVKKSFLAGAIAYIRKDEPQTWLECIKEISKSTYPQRVIPDSISELILERLKKVPDIRLTDRQLEAVQWLAQDKTIKEVGVAMGITFEGANFNIDNAKAKLEAKTLQGLITKAFQYGYLL